jgi:uncharacterized protein (TIGR02217 family)
MSFDDVRLPDNIEKGAVGGPRFQTSIVKLGSGGEQRNSDWPSAQCEFDISYGIDSKADFMLVIAFFRARLGRARGFRFRDWSDYQGVNETLGTGNGTRTQFQIVRNYTSLVTFARKITRIVSGTLTVTLDNVPTGSYTLTSTGLLTLSPAPANGVVVRASFEFDVPCRFDSDKLNINLETFDAASIETINVVELVE